MSDDGPFDLLDYVRVIDITSVLDAENLSPLEKRHLGDKVMTSLVMTGCVVVRDPRVSQNDNGRFLDQMEDYFARPAAQKAADVRADLAYQVGATPEGVEAPRCLFDEKLKAEILAQPLENRATMPSGPDVKWRYFWRIGQRPQGAEDGMNNVVPMGIPQWTTVMETWGQKLLNTAVTVSELLALGLDAPASAFTDKLRNGPHLLAPTGIDLTKHSASGQVCAGYHYDLNFLTIHGRSRYPGLSVWLRDGRRIPVRLPAGCILIQAGRQLEWLTGGLIRAGMHEVVCSDATALAMQRAAAAHRPLWRVSSTVFAHIRSDVVLAPLPGFGAEVAARYKPVTAGAFVREEIEAIKLAKRC